MKTLNTLAILAVGTALLMVTGCKTEVNNAPPPGGSDHTTVIHDNTPDNSNPPPVQNNIHVDR